MMRYRWIWVLLLLVFRVELFGQTEVGFSRQGGFYEDSFDLTLTCAGQYPIRYTVNGATPTASSTLYSQALHLDEALYSKSNIYTIHTAYDELFFAPESVQHCITIRAAAFDEAGTRVGPVATQSYFIRSLGCDTHGLPVMALSADSLALFDYDTGILVPGVHFDTANPMWTGNFYESGIEWERPVNVEYYELSDNSGINQQAGLRTHGGTARRNLQKGMKLYAREEYGSKRFRHRFFDAIPNESFKHLVLKPFYDQWFVTGIQDDIANHMARQLDVESLASRPIILYLNGEYWGVYYLKEKPDAHYLEDHLGHSDDEFNVIGNWYGEAEDGDGTDFITMMYWMKDTDFSDNDNYVSLCSKIDVDCFIDYYCLELFIGNNDWPANNMRCYQWRDDRWRWIFFDGDDALLKKDFDVFYNATTTDDLGWPTDSWSTLMFRKLLENESFKIRFVTRFNELMASEFRYTVTKGYFEEAAAAVRESIPDQANRFNAPKSLSYWEDKIRIIDGFLKNRADNMKDRLRDFFVVENNVLTINSIYPNPSAGEIHFKLWSNGFTLHEIRVYDVMGRSVYASGVWLREGENNFMLPKSLSPGLYLLQFGNQTRRFVVQ